ncbi:MAG: outer membrane protein assembly factor BamB family protein [Verrucomicrobiota bacterium]
MSCFVFGRGRSSGWIGLLLGLSAACALADANSQTAPALLWSTKLSRWVDVCPAIGDDGTVYLGGFDEKLLAVNTQGELKWSFKTDAEIRSPPAIGSDGTLYFGCRDRNLYAVTAEGKKRWSFSVQGWIDSSPALASDGTIYFGSWDKFFYALHPDGTLKWKFQTKGEIESSPAIDAEGAVYFGSHDMNFYALAPDGAKRWEFKTGGPIISSPALNGEGVIYFTSVDGYLYALNAGGALRWRLHTGGATRSSPVIGADGAIYVGVKNSVWAISPEGKKNWQLPISEPLRSSLTALADNTVLVSSPFRDLINLDATGKPIWSYYLDPPTEASPAVAPDGTLYVVGRDHFLKAFNGRVPLAASPWPKFHGNRLNTGNLRPTP